MGAGQATSAYSRPFILSYYVSKGSPLPIFVIVFGFLRTLDKGHLTMRKRFWILDFGTRTESEVLRNIALLYVLLSNPRLNSSNILE